LLVLDHAESLHQMEAWPMQRAAGAAIGRPHPDYAITALVLQGGQRALASYQAGAYQALPEAGIHPNWVAGISREDSGKS
jgi:NTE family protein